MNQYLAITSNGLENLLADELTQLGVSDAKPVQAGVRFSADQALIYRCCLWSRLASRFIRVLSEFHCNDDMDLYLSVTAINWSSHFNANKRFVVDFNGTNREIRNSQYGAMKVKDGVVDSFTKRNLPRPQISKDQSDLRIHVRLHRDKAILGIDMVGAGLHQRGYRTQAGAAPLRETLACAIIVRSGWDRSQPLLDPMCGSGTLLIEAALMAANVAPGVKRAKWAFEALNDFDAELWAEIKAQAAVQGRKGLKSLTTTMLGFDNDQRVLQAARDNARRAGVDHIVQFELADAAKLQKPVGLENGVVICNPPYGERLSTEPALIALYTAFGAQMKTHFTGWQASIFSSSEELLSCLRMRADKQFKLANGALQCHQKNYAITARGHKAGDDQPQQNTTTVNTEQIAPEFANRLKKNINKIGKWAKREQLDCYRAYDADLPNYNVAIDCYQDHVVIQEYAAPKSIPEEVAKRRLTDIIRATIEVLNVDANKVILKTRQKQKGKRQYQRMGQEAEYLQVNEYGVRLLVNVHDYLDTGLFLDHKLTRRRLGQMAAGKDFLNLFAYTGTASVHASAGGAKSTTTVDMSNTYLQWAQRNMELNGFTGEAHQFEQADCLQWLEHEDRQFDLIFIDPPTFSNSKRMEQTFDVQRDHLQLMTNLKRLLRPEGVVVFSNNKRHFKMDVDGLKQLGLTAENISDKTLPLDFARNKQIHNSWIIKHQ